LPFTTIPIIKTPVHLSYILYASRFSRTLALAYFRFGILMCRMTGVAPSILLHPLDFIGAEDTDALQFFPGMDIPLEKKIDVVDQVLDSLVAHFDMGTVLQHVESAGTGLRNLVLRESVA
jgi:hypothetical protein